MNRATWKAYYRLMRIIRRETYKAHTDCLLYGTGFVRVSDEGFVNHIYPWAVRVF